MVVLGVVAVEEDTTAGFEVVGEGEGEEEEEEEEEE